MTRGGGAAGLVPPAQPLTDGVVTLREWRPTDVDAVVAALRDPEISRWTAVPRPYGAADFHAWLDAQATQRQAGTGVHLLVVDGEDRVLGAAGVHFTEDAPDIGYWCAREHRGRGYAARAVRLLRDHLHDLGFPRVDIFTHPENVASQRVAEATGFRRRPGVTTIGRLGDATVLVRFSFP